MKKYKIDWFVDKCRYCRYCKKSSKSIWLICNHPKCKGRTLWTEYADKNQNEIPKWCPLEDAK